MWDMTGGNAGEPTPDGSPESSTAGAAPDPAPGFDAPRTAEAGAPAAGLSTATSGIAPNADTPPSGTPAFDDGLPPIVEATSSTPPVGTPAAPTSPAPPTPMPSTPSAEPPPTADTDEPQLSAGTPTTGPAAATMTESISAPSARSGSAYRSTEERNRSVYRRANPWYRRLARGTIAAVLIAALAGGVYLGALALQDYLDRDQLPSVGPDIPTIRETSFLIESSAAGVELDGTLSVDIETGAFEFVGAAGGPNAADRLTSPDGTVAYAPGTGSTWIEQPPTTPVVMSVRRAIELLSDDNTADAILTNEIRRGYVDLVRQIEEGTDDNTRTRYDVTLDLTSFAESFPLQWQSFRTDAIPGVRESRRHPLSIWLDDEEVLVQVDDEAAGWNWQRLTYSGAAFEPFAPAPNQIEQLDVTPVTEGAIACSVDELGLSYTTTLPTCDDADDVGRGLAVTTGLADVVADRTAQLAYVSVCAAIQGDEIVSYDSDAYLDLATLLDDTGVCPGDIGLVQIGEQGSGG